MFALTLTMIVLVLGAAVDVSNMVSERTKLQDVADRAALAAATSGLDTEEELQDYISVYLTNLEYENIDADVSLTAQNTVIVKPRIDYSMLIMGAVGYKNKLIQASAEVPLAGKAKANLALVLDTTLSMGGTRMDTLKAASADLIRELEKLNTNGQDNVQVSLVPFANYVKIPTSYKGENWLELQPDRTETWQVLDEENSVNCRQVVNGEEAYTECDSYAYTLRTDLVSWQGCMGSRANGHHKTPEFNGNRMQGFVAYGSCNSNYSALMPLTANLTEIGTAIQSLNPQGNTYIPAGLIWGWRTLDESLPFSQPPNEGKNKKQKIMLLMTDGSNTVHLRGTKPDFNGIYHWGDSDNPEQVRTESDGLTAELCTAIKSDGIRLITVAFEVQDDSTKTLLRNCASSGFDFYDATNSAQLMAAFSKIGAGLNKVRLLR